MGDRPSELGPILAETQAAEYQLDVRKLPGELRTIRSYVAKDRDTGCNSEVIVTWAGHVLYRTGEVHRYGEIQARIRAMRFQLEVRDGALEMTFPEAQPRKNGDRRRSDRRKGDRRTTDRRSGDERRG